jgi:phage FluMu protein Com
MSIKCHQCGHEISDYEKAKKCPKCGDTLKDEMVERVRKRVRFRRKDWKVVLGLVVIAIVMCLVCVYAQRFYSWEEKKTSTIKDNDESLYCCVHSKYGCTSYCTHYNLHLADGHVESVDRSTYDSYDKGENYTYSITHIDWKPGQRDAPLPPWVFIVPTGVAVSVVFVLWYRIVSRREKELKEWVETGDLEMKE